MFSFNLHLEKNIYDNKYFSSQKKITIRNKFRNRNKT